MERAGAWEELTLNGWDRFGTANLLVKQTNGQVFLSRFSSLAWKGGTCHPVLTLTLSIPETLGQLTPLSFSVSSVK